MLVAAEILLLTLLSVLAAGSLSNLSSHPHWLIRGWDFPRVQIVVLAWLITIVFMLIERFASEAPIPVWIPTSLTIALTVWHGIRIAPYTVLAPKQARGTRTDQRHGHRSDASTIRVVISNVQQENDQHQTWRRVIEEADADVVVILEADEVWVRAAEPLFDRYPHRFSHPQDNCYGMVLLSRLPIRNHRTRFLVQDDVPSMDAEIEMPTDQIIRLVAVHPRPPEPIRDNGAVARDAELTLWGEELEDESKPTVICGDLNDVAWSQTTRLFLRVSGLLDPRRGRGFFNTFHADYWFLRFPLDHIFHSVHFTVSGMRRLPYIGSDHFPMQIDLRLEPDRREQHDVLDEQADDDAEAAARIERAQEKTDTNGEVDRTSTEQAVHH
jgi:endonuclease/exonuclease/phosphatase (EEP) superfamily protein YafD